MGSAEGASGGHRWFRGFDAAQAAPLRCGRRLVSWPDGWLKYRQAGRSNLSRKQAPRLQNRQIILENSLTYVTDGGSGTGLDYVYRR
jgi:hypothetical protein